MWKDKLYSLCNFIFCKTRFLAWSYYNLRLVCIIQNYRLWDKYNLIRLWSILCTNNSKFSTKIHVAIEEIRMRDIPYNKKLNLQAPFYLLWGQIKLVQTNIENKKTELFLKSNFCRWYLIVCTTWWELRNFEEIFPKII